MRTGPGGRAAVRLASGISLRLAENSEIVFAKPPLIELAAGRAYVDNDGRQAGARVEIITSIANVTDVGTQFEVGLVGDQYRLRVRQGRVQLRHGMARIDGIAGDELTIRADGAVERSSISPTDDEWRWVEAIATAPDVNDRPVTELLNWVARETGRPIRFQDADVERRAGSIILHGSIRHLAPLDALSRHARDDGSRLRRARRRYTPDPVQARPLNHTTVLLRAEGAPTDCRHWRRGVTRLLAIVASLPVVPAFAAGLAGTPLSSAVADLERRGLVVLYSSDLVRPWMKVASDPTATDPAAILAEILAPHGLAARPGPGGLLLVVRRPRLAQTASTGRTDVPQTVARESLEEVIVTTSRYRLDSSHADRAGVG